MNSWKRLRHRFEYAAIWLLMLLIRIAPLKVMRGAGAAMGWIAFNLLRIRRDVTLENLSNAIGNRHDPGGLKRIASRSYMNMGRSFVEFASFLKLSGEEICSMVSFEGLNHFDEVLKEGRGALLIAGHFDNWELLGVGVARHGYPVHFLVGEQKNKLVDDLMNKLRLAQGVGIISRKVALRKVLRTLSNNQIIAMLPDQRAGRTGVFVDFFGRPASTFRGPAVFAIKQGCPLVPCFIIRKAGKKHLGVVEKPIYPDKGNDREREVLRLTEAYTKVLEDYITRYPDHYFWPHRRWKTKPPPP